ncbi:MAG: hypothetical protein JNK99_07945 [Candidatus Accumulibacter sp.]|jgi:hypothetical protein|uniref:hypothetical protein n=1 Tax=Accumulibacter sp. TaxID=2053492 RepID=UPI001A3F7F4B|nr:hypothetical protein [Accumulibacter sp.]MBL8394665.1 hypothetical protein [Accumulibacter sp.]
MKKSLFRRDGMAGKYLQLAVLFTGLLGYLSGPTFGTAQAASLDMPPPTKDADALAVAYDCLASLARYSRGSKALLGRAKADGDELLSMATVDGNKRTGWPYIQRTTEESKKCGQAGALDAFGDGTCNPPETPYMLQTGYAVACLAQLNIATGDVRYLQVARKALSDSWSLGSAVTGCQDCFYYWYSYHANDLNRFVRNPNVAMGLGLAWMFAATGEAIYRERALAIAKAEHHEIQAGNAGYFGIDDPKYKANPKFEAQRIENHVPHQVKGLKDISKLTGNAQALGDAKSEMDSFLYCRNDRCRPGNCKAWAAPPSCQATATIAPCILADQGDPYQSLCEVVLKELPRLNAFQIFLLDSASGKEGLITR